MKAGGSLPQGRRLRDEVPDVPDPGRLSEIQKGAQVALRALVEQAGGRYDSREPIPVGRVEVFMDLFDEWATYYGTRTPEGIFFQGRPGLWHALDELFPLQDPNRWDALRGAVIAELERRHWTRRTPPRGSTFDIAV
jgi:hypothetical protein